MSSNQSVHRIAIVGTGVIGASWAAYYLARGFDVVATDPGSQAEANLRKYVDDAWPLLTQVGLSPDASRDRLTFSPDMSRALAQADWVQENAPERPGQGGIQHFMEHLMDPLAAMMKTLGTPEITQQLKQTVVDAVLKEAGGRSVEELAREENLVLTGLLKLRSEANA
jgi:glycine/D-amino acid oxidase-like deaminating enzyme